LVLAFLAATAELVFGKWFERSAHCVDPYLHHAYCPGIVYYSLLSREDGGASVENVIDRSRIRVADPSLKDGVTDVSQYDILNVGDSFVEAHKVPYEETLSSVWGRLSGKRVLQFGYSSWSPIIYYNWLLGQKLKPGVIVNIFVMENDMTPAGGTSNASYHEQAVRDSRGAFIFPGQQEHALKNLIKRHSWFYERVYSRRYVLQYHFSQFVHRIMAATAVAQSSKGTPEKWLDGDFSTPGSDCTKLDTLRKQFEGLPEYLALDYLAFAFTRDCWDETQKSDVESVIEDVNRIVDVVSRAGSRVNVLFVPPGWSFPGENLPGKADHHYLIREGTVITSEPLVEYLRSRIHVRVISLEAVIKELKTRHPGAWYFPQDGHWTPHAHRHLGAWLHENLR
jgi:hypothetical protein